MAKSGGDKHEKNAEISSFGRILYGFWRLFSSRMVWPRSTVCKYIYHINKSQTDTFQDKDNSYISA